MIQENILKNPLVSIIIPIYNTEKYLLRCLSSVLESPENIEVICVDDGSTDHSLRICEELKERDARVRIFTQKHQGVAVARNKGLSLARGNWIFFVVSDDVVFPGYYNLIADIELCNDICIFDVIWGNKKYDNERENERRFIKNDKTFLITKMFESKSFSDKARTSLRSPCAKIYRRKFLSDNKIEFPQNVKIGEDFLFNISAFFIAATISYKPVDVYQQIDREGSATNSYVGDMIENDILFQKELKRRLIQYGIYDQLEAMYYSEVKSGIMRCLRKQIFYRGKKKSFGEKKKLLGQLLNKEIYLEGLSYKDSNKKRGLIMKLVKYKCVLSLEIIMKIESRR